MLMWDRESEREGLSMCVKERQRNRSMRERETD